MNELEGDGGEPSLEECVRAKEKVDALLRHISNVQEACQLLGRRLIDKGEIDLGIHLIAAGQTHDHSKWSGIEWDYLVGSRTNGNGALALAVSHHQRTNKHHPEFWGSASNMPRLYVAEMCCDFYARATEFGTNVWEWIKEDAMPKYGIPRQGKIYKWMKEFLGLLLEKPFSDLGED